MYRFSRNMNVFLNYPVDDYNMFFDSVEADLIMYHIVRKYRTYVWHKLFHPDFQTEHGIHDLDKGRLFYVDADNEIKLRTINKLIRCSSIEEFFFGAVKRKYEKKNQSTLKEGEKNKEEDLILMFFDEGCLPAHTVPHTDKSETIKTSVGKKIDQLLMTKNEIIIRNVCILSSSFSLHDLQEDDFEKSLLDQICSYIFFDRFFARFQQTKTSVKKFDILANEIFLPFKLEYYVLLDIITTNNLPWTFNEKYFMRKGCERAFTIFSLDQKVTLTFSVFSRKKETTVRYDTFLIQGNKTKRREKEIFDLLEIYIENEEKTKEVYDLFNEKEKNVDLNRKGTLEELRGSVPELFVKGYSRLCPDKPFIVSEEEALILEEEGRATMTYPMEHPMGKYQRIYACPEGFYPGLKKNSLENSSLFEYLPVCYRTNHLDNPRSNLNRYLFSFKDNSKRAYNEKYDKSKNVDKLYLTKMLQRGEKGKVSWILQEILGEKAIRIGTKRGVLSALDAIDASKEVIEEQIISHLLKTNRKLNPISFLNILEKNMKSNIIIFNEDGIDPAMLGLVGGRTKKYDCYVVLFNSKKNDGHYEKIINFDENLLNKYIQFLPAPSDMAPFHLSGSLRHPLMSSFQQLNKLEESQGSPTHASAERLFDSSLCKNSDSTEMEKAYFIHDLFHIFEMNRRATDVVYSIDAVSNLKKLDKVKVHRFSFRNAEEMKDYYSSIYPFLFDSDKKLMLTKEMFDRLNYIPFEELRTRRYMFFLDVLKARHFTQRKNNVIVISPF